MVDEEMAKSSDNSLAGKDLRGDDLRGADLTDKVLFGADARGAKFYDAKVSLNCATFDGLRLDDEQFALLALLIARADVDGRWKAGIQALVSEICGGRNLHAYLRYLDLA